MIRRLKLLNWRTYEDVAISFEPGTTFVVASNGVGKSSLVEAARWALFGVPASSGTPVRVGSDEASVEVELILPNGRTLTIERTVKAKVGRGRSTSTVMLDGAAVDDPALGALLADSYRTDPAFLARLAMPAIAREQDTPEGLGLEEHLGRYFGVHGLQVATEALQTELSSLEKQIRLVKVANAASAKQLADQRALVDATSSDAELALKAHKAAVNALEATRLRNRAAEISEAWVLRNREYAARTGQIENEFREKVGDTFGTGEFERDIRQRIDDLILAAEEARVRRAVGQARAEAITANAARLEDAHEDCPVCRRELDDATVALARQANEAEMRTLEEEIARNEATASQLGEERQRLEELLQRWRAVPLPGPEPEKPEGSIPTLDELEHATTRVAEALDALVEARSQAAEAKRRLGEAIEADEAMRQLEGLFQAEAETRVTLDVTRATLEELLQQTVRPLEREVNARWKALFPGRGDLSTRANGEISRAVGDAALPFESFSTGEGMGALLILRLLVAQMATTSDFCWFDEPLEHLDPDVRRQVANILSRAADGTGQLRQVVVTTYEEPLARQLRARAPNRVHLIDVRHGS